MIKLEEIENFFDNWERKNIKEMSKIIIVDVEADGPVPGINSMVCFGAVVVGELPLP